MGGRGDMGLRPGGTGHWATGRPGRGPLTRRFVPRVASLFWAPGPCQALSRPGSGDPVSAEQVRDMPPGVPSESPQRGVGD